jgi:hypothetical protein
MDDFCATQTIKRKSKTWAALETYQHIGVIR